MIPGHMLDSTGLTTRSLLNTIESSTDGAIWEFIDDTLVSLGDRQ